MFPFAVLRINSCWRIPNELTMNQEKVVINATGNNNIISGTGDIEVNSLPGFKLTAEWLSAHLERAKNTAGPRYTPELNVKTDLWKWFAAFGRTAEWSDELKGKLWACRQAQKHLVDALHTSKSDPALSAWPETLHTDAQALADDTETLLNEYDRLAALDDASLYKRCISKLSGLLKRLASLETDLLNDFDGEHGARADSSRFRQFMAEYNVSFPAANLDSARDTNKALMDLHDWLQSPAGSLAYERVFVLSGVAGSGKTHGVCDAVMHRFSEGFLTCMAFGHEFRGGPDPWTRLRESLGLPNTLGMDDLLDLLNDAGETSGSLLILCIDAVNETRPLRYWRDRLPAVVQAIQQRPHLRLCVTCRTPFIPYCLPDGHGLTILEHSGFVGIEREACREFFNHYGLEPPLTPCLQPELSNPLCLRLVCETLRSRGSRRLPPGWHGFFPTIRAFLDEKERQFALEHETDIGAKIMSGCLRAIACEIAASGDAALSWSKACEIIATTKPQAANLNVLEWLVRADLLLENVSAATDSFSSDEESVVRPAFERLGDFLIVTGILETARQTGLDIACQTGGAIHALLKDSEKLEQNTGILAALSILIPEYDADVEFPDLIKDDLIRNELVRITIQAFPSRNPATFTIASESLIREALGRKEISFDAMDALLAVSWQPSVIDAIWLDKLFKQKSLAIRDAYWCAYLHERFESQGIVYRLINAASDLPLEQIEPETAERWAIVLLWFNAAADRRVKDEAARAVIAILTAQAQLIPDLLSRLLDSYDDEVHERVLLCCYGALIISRDTGVLRLAAEILQEAYQGNPALFNNALIRDHIRCIAELARELNALPENCEPELTMRPIASEWPPEMPSSGQIEQWSEALHFKPDEFSSDFFKNSMGCLNPWIHTFSKKNMGEWILQRAMRDFGYKDSGCENYDRHMLGKYGGGRSKPVWVSNSVDKSHTIC